VDLREPFELVDLLEPFELVDRFLLVEQGLLSRFEDQL